MAKATNGRHWKRAFKWAVSLGLVFISCCFVGWLWAPSLIEDWFTETMAEEGYEASLTVDNLGVSDSVIGKLSLIGPGVNLQVGEIRAEYGFGSLTEGRAERVVVKEVDLELNIDELPEEDDPEEPIPLEEQLRQWMQLASFDKARLENANVGVTFDDNRTEHWLNGRLSASDRSHLTIDSNTSLGSVDLQVNLHERSVDLSMDLRMDELAKIVPLAQAFLGELWPAGLDMQGEKLEAKAKTRVQGDALVPLEINATVKDLALALPTEEGNGSGFTLTAADLTVAMPAVGNALTLSGERGGFLGLSELNATINSLDEELVIKGLNGAVRFDSLETLVISEPQELGFDELTYGAGSEALDLVDGGSLRFSMPKPDGPVSVILNAPLVDAYEQVRLKGLEFNGSLASLDNPVLSSPQILRCDSVLLAGEITSGAPALEDFNMTFRLDEDGALLVDALDFNASGTRIEIRPQLAKLTLDDDGGGVLDLNVTIKLSDNNELNATIEGLAGTVRFDSIETLVISEPQELSFTELSYGARGEILHLEDGGTLRVSMPNEDGPVSVILTAETVVANEQARLVNLEFNGSLASLDNPVLSSPQTLRCKRVTLAGENQLWTPALNDFNMTFHESNGTGAWSVDALGFQPDLLEDSSGERVEVLLQRAEVTLDDDGGGDLDLNVTIKLSDDNELNATVEGLAGKVSFKVNDTLVISETKKLSFVELSYGAVRWGPGEVAFLADEKFHLKLFKGDFCGGILRVEPTEFDLSSTELKFDLAVAFETLDAEALVKIMPGFEGELRGLLSGRVSISNQEENWNFLDGGHIEMKPDPKGYLSYPSDGLLTAGMEPESKDYKRSRLLELALQDLDVDKLHLEFLENLIEGRVIKGEILGASTVDKKKIKVTYRPKVRGDLIALLKQLEFAGLSFE